MRNTCTDKDSEANAELRPSSRPRQKKRREGDTLYFEILVYRPASFLCIGRAVEAAQRAAGARPARRRRPMPAAPHFKGPVHLALYLIQGRWLGGSAEADPLCCGGFVLIDDDYVALRFRCRFVLCPRGFAFLFLPCRCFGVCCYKQ